MKYIVNADTYARAYGITYHIFAICDSKEEAIKYIMDNPVHKVADYDEFHDFDFFEHYEQRKIKKIYKHEGGTTKAGHPRLTCVGERILSKEEYAEQFIAEFDEKPLCICSYIE